MSSPYTTESGNPEKEKNTDLKVKTPKEIKLFTDRKSMGRFFLFFLFSFFINFSATGGTDKQITYKFDKNKCQGSEVANSYCSEKKPENGKALDKPGTASPDGNPSSPKGGPANCEAGLRGPNGIGAETCCSDPTTCLGGKELSTFQDVSNIVSKVGPGMAMMLQGFGEDMSGLCKAMQGLAGSGASLSMAAKLKCDGAISSCHSICDRDIKIQCKKYNEAKNECLIKQEKNPPPDIYDSFEKKAQPAANLIQDYDNTKSHCTAQKVKSKELLDNMGEMANSAISSELCKQQSKIAHNKEKCRAAGGTWTNFECKMPEKEEEKTETVSLRDGEGSIPQQPTGYMGINTETPVSTSQDTVPNPDDPDNTRVGGGGNSNNPPGGEGPTPYPKAATDIDPEVDHKSDSDGTGTTTADQSKSSGTSSLFNSFGESGYNSPYRRANNEEGEDNDNLSMGGGGFKGYGGGGGFGDSDSQASLGLSKKKLEELKKKKGAQRVTASDAKGTHQNIFERITKRFQSLCQSKLDCQ